MKFINRFFLTVSLSIVLAGLMAPLAHAVTPNYAIAIPGVQTLVLPISGQRTATVTPISFKLPFKAILIGVSATARASGGTTPTLTVDLKNASTSLLSAAITVTAGAIAEGTVATATIADESTLNVVLTIGGTSPTWDDVVVTITLIRQ